MFYGWRIVGGSFLSQAFVVGFFTYAVSLLTKPVQDSFGVSVEAVWLKFAVSFCADMKSVWGQSGISLILQYIGSKSQYVLALAIIQISIANHRTWRC